MNLYQADFQLAAIKHLRWMPDRIQIEQDELILDGWVLGLWDAQASARFLMNGEDFDVVEWPLPSPDLSAYFPDIPHIDASRFRCRHYFSDLSTLFPQGMARFNVTQRYGEHAWSYRTAWFLAAQAQERPLPPPEQITRVIGAPNIEAFCWGGATIVARFAHLLAERFGRPLSSFASVLDWGCGVGRLTRYLLSYGPAVTGVDSDPEHLRLCRETLAGAEFQPITLLPPTTLATASFDLVIGLSAFTHLTASSQAAWLAELQRITSPNGLLLLSVQGMTQMALHRMPIELKQAAHQHGLYTAHDQPEPPMVIHSAEYILSQWGAYFEVLEIIEGIAGHQDLVVLRRRNEALIRCV